MTRVLITGGTGMLGRELRPRLLAVGYTVRILSRRAPNPGEDTGVEWAQARLEKGDGLAEAVSGADVIVHAASSLVRRAANVDGTQKLLDHARLAGVGHFVYISIVGIDQIKYAYYQQKLAAEHLIEASGLPWTNLRATQFHYLVDKVIQLFTRLPIAFMPTDWRFQTISTAEAADHMLKAVQDGPSGRLPDIGGPEVLTLKEMTRPWLAAQGMRRPIVHVPFPAGLSAGFRQALNTTPDNAVGVITWNAWLRAKYGQGNVGSPERIVTEGHSL